MKRLAILIVALSVIGIGAAFAQDEEASEMPTVTWGVDGSYGYNVFSSHKSADTSDGATKHVASSTPYGFGATGFVVAPWFQIDWERLMVKVAGRYDQLDNDDEDNYSNVKMSSTYSDLFGIFTLYNDFTYRVAEDSGNPQMEFDGHDLGLGVAVDDFSARINWGYDNGGRFLGTNADNAGVESAAADDSLDQAVGDIAGLNQFYSFKDLTMSMDNGVVGAMAVWEALETDADLAQSGYYLTNAYLKGYDWFGIWDMIVGDQDNGKQLRMSGAGPRGYTSQMGIGEFGASSFGFVNVDGEDVAEPDRKIDVYNTFDAVPGLKLMLGTIMPMDDESSSAQWNNWLADGNLWIGAEYAIEGVATVNTGMGVVNDYFVESDMDYVVSQAGDVVDDAGGTETIGNRSNFWLDVAATPMEALKVQLGIDGQFSRYRDQKKAATDATKYTYVDFAMYNLGLEASYAMAPLSLSTGIYTAFGTGFDYETFTGTKFKDAWGDSAAGVENMKNFDEDSVAMAAVYSDEAFDGDDNSLISPFIFDISVGYTVSETLSVSLSNSFNAFAGAIDAAPIANNSDGDWDAVAAPASADKEVRGYYGENTLELGATVVPAESQSLGVTVGYTLFTGVPAEGDFYTNATDDQSVEYEVWRTNEWQPFSVGVSYSYKY